MPARRQTSDLTLPHRCPGRYTSGLLRCYFRPSRSLTSDLTRHIFPTSNQTSELRFALFPSSVLRNPPQPSRLFRRKKTIHGRTLLVARRFMSPLPPFPLLPFVLLFHFSPFLCFLPLLCSFLPPFFLSFAPTAVPTAVTTAAATDAATALLMPLPRPAPTLEAISTSAAPIWIASPRQPGRRRPQRCHPYPRRWWLPSAVQLCRWREVPTPEPRATLTRTYRRVHSGAMHIGDAFRQNPTRARLRAHSSPDDEAHGGAIRIPDGGGFLHPYSCADGERRRLLSRGQPLRGICRRILSGV